MAMSPEGMAPQESQPQQDPSQGIAQGLEALQSGTQALVQGLTDGGAPPEMVQLAQTAADAIAQLTQAISGGGQQAEQPSAQEQVA